METGADVNEFLVTMERLGCFCVHLGNAKQNLDLGMQYVPV